MSCVQCKRESKYKCPVCRKPYCSVVCYKEHKENPCSVPELPKDIIETKTCEIEYDYPTEDTVPIDKLKLLKDSKEVRQCLENPHVRTILNLLDKTSHPDDLIQEYMQEPIFTEFVDACLKIVQQQE